MNLVLHNLADNRTQFCRVFCWAISKIKNKCRVVHINMNLNTLLNS